MCQINIHLPKWHAVVDVAAIHPLSKAPLCTRQ